MSHSSVLSRVLYRHALPTLPGIADGELFNDPESAREIK